MKICPICLKETKVKGKAKDGKVFGSCGCEFYISRKSFYAWLQSQDEAKEANKFFANRAKEKQASRDKDEQDLASGIKTRDQLSKENGFLSFPFAVVDISNAITRSRDNREGRLALMNILDILDRMIGLVWE